MQRDHADRHTKENLNISHQLARETVLKGKESPAVAGAGAGAMDCKTVLPEALAPEEAIGTL
jgi:hypothetical protein